MTHGTGNSTDPEHLLDGVRERAATTLDRRRTTIGTEFYTTAMQMVPLLLIALFVDNRDDVPPVGSSGAQRWKRLQDQAFALLAVAAFFTSMFVAADVIRPSRFTTALVISALGGTMALLLLQMWRRFDRRRGDVDRHPSSTGRRTSRPGRDDTTRIG